LQFAIKLLDGQLRRIEILQESNGDLAASLKKLASRMRFMLDQDLCECEGIHTCGKADADRDVARAVELILRQKT
jgi:hypothetical protein